MLDHHRARGHRAGSGPSQGYSRMLLVLLFLALKATRGSACGEGSVGVTPHWRPAERAEGVYCSLQRWHWRNLTRAVVAHDPLAKLQYCKYMLRRQNVMGWRRSEASDRR